MYQYARITLNSIIITDTGLSNGTPFLSEVEGLSAFALTKQVTAIVAIDGTVYEQFSADNKGLPISVKFDLLPAATYASLVATIQASRTANTTILLAITGAAASVRLSVRCTGIEAPDKTLEAGLLGVKFNFIVADLYNTLSATAGVYETTGRAVSLIYSGA